MLVFVSGLTPAADQHAASLDASFFLLLLWLVFLLPLSPLCLLFCLFVPLLTVSISAAQGGEALFPHVGTSTAGEQRETHKTAIESQ